MSNGHPWLSHLRVISIKSDLNKTLARLSVSTHLLGRALDSPSMKIFAVIITVLLLAGCSRGGEDLLVLKYNDFGPQAAAYELIGMEWWQWDNHGSSDPNMSYDINVVVYRDTTLPQVKKAYPVVPAKNRDYRYLSYAKAIDYLKRYTEEDSYPELKETLLKTHLRIENHFGRIKN